LNIHYKYESPFGKLIIVSDGSAIISLKRESASVAVCGESSDMLTDQAAKELDEYFAGKRRGFNVPIRAVGTVFRQGVWEQLLAIPYGETRSYKQVAQNVGNTGASRAVGMANNKNPISIIIPCHRVIGSNGSLVGYAGGLDMKRALLDMEKSYIQL